MLESPRPVYPNELYHYGVKGMHWGIRRYQPYPKGYSGKGRYLGRIQGGAKVDKMTAEEKKRIKRRNRLILAGAGILAGGAAYTIGRKMLKKGNVEREAMARNRMKSAGSSMSKYLDEETFYRDMNAGRAFMEGIDMGNPDHAKAIDKKMLAAGRKARIKEHQADRYEKLANKYINARTGGKMIKNIGRNLLLSSAGGVVAREILDTYNEKKRKKKR